MCAWARDSCNACIDAYIYIYRYVRNAMQGMYIMPCMHVYMHVRVHVCMYVCIRAMHASNVCMYVMHVCIVCMYVCACMHVCGACM